MERTLFGGLPQSRVRVQCPPGDFAGRRLRGHIGGRTELWLRDLDSLAARWLNHVYAALCGRPTRALRILAGW